jgi:hypothetical protein
MNIDPKIYDLKSIKIDAQFNNFDPECLEDYRKTNIVKASLINGQRKQAIEQCKEFNLNIEEVK